MLTMRQGGMFRLWIVWSVFPLENYHRWKRLSVYRGEWLTKKLSGVWRTNKTLTFFHTRFDGAMSKNADVSFILPTSEKWYNSFWNAGSQSKVLSNDKLIHPTTISRKWWIVKLHKKLCFLLRSQNGHWQMQDP